MRHHPNIYKMQGLWVCESKSFRAVAKNVEEAYQIWFNMNGRKKQEYEKAPKIEYSYNPHIWDKKHAKQK